MNRRDFLTISAGALAGAPLLDGQSSGAQPTHQDPSAFSRTHHGKRPHILLISADMVSPDMYLPGRPLSTQVRLPAIRSLMHEGCFFSNAFCTVPLCSPSRASYLTGRYSNILGNGEHAPSGLETQLRDSDVIFPEYLRASGYLCRQVGKCHVGTKKFLDAFGENDHPWDRWSPPVFQDDEFLSYQRRIGVKPQKYSREIVFRMQDRKTPGNSMGGWIVQQDGKPFPLEGHYSYYLGLQAMETIDNFAAVGELHKRPFYLQLDIFDPHQPFSIPAGFEDRERELRRSMTVPASYQAAKERDWKAAPDEPEVIDIYRKYWGIYDENQLLDYRVAYALQMELVDKVIGMVLDHLKKRGLYDDALVAFISDHGEMNGRHAMVDKGVYHYPDILRVPLVMKPPRDARPARAVVDTPVSLLDLSPTILEFAGIETAAKNDGISLHPALRGEAIPADRTLLFFGGWHVAVNFACGTQHIFPDGSHFLYSYNLTSRQDVLYDMRSEDAVNLIGDDRYRDMREQMIRMLGEALQADPRWSGYWGEFRLARFNDLPAQQAGDMQKLSTRD
ncbi:MAG TPA: sulfatase-like hydrolase/transferase [Terracidiphilus sp.]|jgi:arylsulfatase A-like enzyme